MIKSGTNILIFAYGLTDLDSDRPEVDLTYHDTCRNTRMIPLRSYADPPSDQKFLGLETFEFRLINVSVSTPVFFFYFYFFSILSHLMILPIIAKYIKLQVNIHSNVMQSPYVLLNSNHILFILM
jgi:hypothetical protein